MEIRKTLSRHHPPQSSKGACWRNHSAMSISIIEYMRTHFRRAGRRPYHATSTSFTQGYCKFDHVFWPRGALKCLRHCSTANQIQGIEIKTELKNQMLFDRFSPQLSKLFIFIWQPIRGEIDHNTTEIKNQKLPNQSRIASSGQGASCFCLTSCQIIPMWQWVNFQYWPIRATASRSPTLLSSWLNSRSKIEILLTTIIFDLQFEYLIWKPAFHTLNSILVIFYNTVHDTHNSFPFLFWTPLLGC